MALARQPVQPQEFLQQGHTSQPDSTTGVITGSPHLIQVLLQASVHTDVQLLAHWGCFALHMSSGFLEPPQLLGRQPLKTWKHLPCVILPAEVPLAMN